MSCADCLDLLWFWKVGTTCFHGLVAAPKKSLPVHIVPHWRRFGPGSQAEGEGVRGYVSVLLICCLCRYSSLCQHVQASAALQHIHREAARSEACMSQWGGASAAAEGPAKPPKIGTPHLADLLCTLGSAQHTKTTMGHHRDIVTCKSMTPKASKNIFQKVTK